MADILLAILGLAILLLAGDVLVRGAVQLSLRLGVPALVVSLTIVAVGTSAPEMLISVDAVLNHAPGIALGNVVGSNTANILLVLGLPAMLMGLATADSRPGSSYIQMLFGTSVFVLLATWAPLTWKSGMVLLTVLAAFSAYAAFRARSNGRRAVRVEEDLAADPGASWPKILALLGVGIIGLPLGAELLVDGAVNIARRLHVSETVIGLTLVAVGTSLPELATTVSAALRRQADVALGNVIGSNIVNLLGIIGVAALFGNIPVEPEVLKFDILVMVLASFVIAPFVFGRYDITRTWGVLFTGLYGIYVLAVFG